MSQQTMYDSVGGVATIPQSAQLILVYIDGAFQTLAIANQTHPFVRKILATTLTPGNINAQVFDCEPGNGNANDAALWSLRKLAIFARPTIYCSRASGSPYDYPSVLASLAAHNIPRSSVDIGIADWTGTPHLVPDSAFTQYANPPSSGGNYDISLTNGTWPDPPTPNPDPIPTPTEQDEMNAIALPDGTIKIYAAGTGTRVNHLLEFTRRESDQTNSVIDITTQIGTAEPYLVAP